MYLLNNHESGLVKSSIKNLNYPVFSSSGKKTARFTSFMQHLIGDEQYHRIGELFLLLVLVLHFWAGVHFLEPVPTLVQAKPLMMAATLLSVPGQKKTIAQAKVAEPSKQQVLPKAAPPKRPVPIKKNKPVIHKQVSISKAVEAEPIHASAEVTEAVQNVSNSNATGEKSNAQAAEVKAESYTEADYRANYSFNPKPEYPSIARSRGWEGKVILRVRVTAEGDSENVSISHSSGYDELDESAVDAVKRWRFIPAKRGETAVACTVNVPIIFTLNN